MRRRGASLRDVHNRLDIPKSTLSYWFRKVPLSPRAKAALRKRNQTGLITARREAVKWHNEQKRVRLVQAKTQALESLARLDISNDAILELALAFLYLGEGSKASLTSLGNSDPQIARFFVRCMQRLYRVPPHQLRCELHLRADQDAAACISFWSKALRIPRANFHNPSIDTRTQGKPTYPGYHGVCIVRCGRVAIQRKLMYIARAFCESIASDTRAVSSLGRASR